MPASSLVATSRRPAVVLASCLLAAGLCAGPLAGPAHAKGRASTVLVQANLAKDGALSVRERVTFTGQPPARLTQKFETHADLVGDRQYVLSLSQVSATAGGTAVNAPSTTDGRFTTVSVPTNGAKEVVLSYAVTGAVVNLGNGDTALRWPLVQGLSVSVESFVGTVQIPGAFSYVKCTAGNPNSAVPCTSASAGTGPTQVPTFRNGPLGEGQVVVADIGFPAGTVAANEKIEQRWTLGRAFSVDPWPLGLALGLLVLGGVALLLLHRRRGIDTGGSGELRRVAEFAPVGPGQEEFQVIDDIRPGHVGTVADERVDPVDVTATVVDLAVRGHLLITELPRRQKFARADWELTRRPGQDQLQPFEQALLDGIAPEGGHLLVSELPGRLQESIPGVQDKLYDEVVRHGWFERRPDSTRSRWTQLALTGLVVAVVVTVLLAAFTTFGLVGLALIVLALGMIFVAQEMPSRTAKGSDLVAGLGALRTDLLTHPTQRLPPGRELEEISQLLPYAIVLGGADRWLDALVASDTDATPDSEDLSWYHGPSDWHLRDLPDSLRNFITTLSGSLFAR